MSKKTTKSTQTTTPNNPTWVSPQIEGLTGQISNLAGQNPQQFVAPTNDLLTKAGQSAGNIAPDNASYGSAKGLFQSLMNTGAQQVTPTTGTSASLLDNLQSYMSPYTKDVVDASLADYDFGAGQALAEGKLALAGDTTFGGSGGMSQLGSTMSGLARGRGTLSSTLRDQAFNTGASLSGQDAGRRQEMSLANMAAQNQAALANAGFNEQALARQQQAGQNLVNTANAGQDAASSAATNQANIGSILQQLQQQGAEAPLSVLSQLTGMYGNMTSPLSLLQGQTTTGKTTQNPGLLKTIGDGLKVAATAATISDGRLKTDIETIGHDAKGRRWVSYRYLWDEPGTRHEGVIAQEVAKTDPHAVVQHEDGYFMVKYGELH